MERINNWRKPFSLWMKEVKITDFYDTLHTPRKKPQNHEENHRGAVKFKLVDKKRAAFIS